MRFSECRSDFRWLRNQVLRIPTATRLPARAWHKNRWTRRVRYLVTQKKKRPHSKNRLTRRKRRWMSCGHKFEKSRWLFQIGKIQVGKIQIGEKNVKIQTQHDPAKKSWTKKNPRSPSIWPSLPAITIPASERDNDLLCNSRNILNPISGFLRRDCTR